MTAEPDFQLSVCRLTLVAREALRLPVPASNRLRGALGFELPGHLFRPVNDAGPSGFHDPPRPFSLRAQHLDGTSLHAGQAFSFDIHIFCLETELFRESLARLPWADLIRWEETPVHLHLTPATHAPPRLRLHFLTPTELKPAVPVGSLPVFSHLMARTRDRLSALRLHYGTGALEMDFLGFTARASEVQTLGGSLVRHSEVRTSARTRQTHPLGGFTGHADYEGDLREFLPWLDAAYHLGLGRHTVWGHGVMKAEALP